MELSEDHQQVVLFLVHSDPREDVDQNLHSVLVDLREERRELAEHIDGLFWRLLSLNALLAEQIGVRLGVEQYADPMQQFEEASLVELVVAGLGLLRLAVRADHLPLQFEQVEQEVFDLRFRCMELGESERYVAVEAFGSGDVGVDRIELSL